MYMVHKFFLKFFVQTLQILFLTPFPESMPQNPLTLLVLSGSCTIEFFFFFDNTLSQTSFLGHQNNTYFPFVFCVYLHLKVTISCIFMDPRYLKCNTLLNLCRSTSVNTPCWYSLLFRLIKTYSVFCLLFFFFVIDLQTILACCICQIFTMLFHGF